MESINKDDVKRMLLPGAREWPARAEHC